MSSAELRENVLLALFYLESPQQPDDVIRLLTVEPFYSYGSSDVERVIGELLREGILENLDGRLASKVPFDKIRTLIPKNDEVPSLLASLSDDELVALEAVLLQHPFVTKQDLDSYGFFDRDGGSDPWRIADATRALGKKRLVVETLGALGEVVFLIPSVIKSSLRRAHRQLLDSKLLPARRRWLETRLEAADAGDQKARAALRAVPHDRFLPEHLRHLAYSGAILDIELPEKEWRAQLGIDGWGIPTEQERRDQSSADDRQISEAPDVNASILSLLNLQQGNRVLMCGAGYGYLEALVAHMVGNTGEVVVIDNRMARLERCTASLKGTEYERRIRLQFGDPTAGYPLRFDRIFVRGSVPRLPRPLVALLAPDGEMVVPIANGVKTLLMMLRREAGIPSFTFKDDAVLYHPLEGAYGWGSTESLTNLESLRVSTLQILRARSSINRAWQGLLDSDLLPPDVDIELSFAALLDPVADEGGFRGFAVALQGVGTERLQTFLPPPTTEKGATSYRTVFSERNVNLPPELEEEVRRVAERLGPARRIRNFMAHPNDSASQADIKKLFRQLLGVPLPSTAVHYGRLQRVMIDEVAAAFEAFANILQRVVAQQEHR